MKTHPSSGNETNENPKLSHVRQKSGQTHNRTPSVFSKKSQMQISPEPYFIGSKVPLSAALNESEIQNFDINTHRVMEESVSSPRLKAKNSLMRYIESDEPKTFEDGSLSKVKFQRFQVMDMSTGIIALIGSFLTIMAYDLEFEQRDTTLLKALLWTIFGSTIIAIFLNVFTLLERIEYLKAKKLLGTKANIKNTGGLWVLLIETFTLLLQPYPFTRNIRINMLNVFEHNLNYYYDLNDLLSLLIVLRVYIILRFIVNTTLYRSPRAQRITQMYGTTNDYLFACRCLTKKNPSVVVTLSFGLSIFIFGYLLRICEKPLSRNQDSGLNDFNSYWNSMWCVVVTMTVVGYGDYYPRTLLGKITTLLICIWGVFVVSLIVVTLTNILAMEAGQEHVLTVLQRLELREELEKEAAYVLTNMARIRLANKRVKDVDEKKKIHSQIITELKNHMQKMKKIDRTLRGVNHSKVKDDMTRHFLTIRNEVKDVIQERNDLLQTIKKLKLVLEVGQSSVKTN